MKRIVKEKVLAFVFLILSSFCFSQTGFEFIQQEITEIIYAVSLTSKTPIVCDDTVSGRASFRFAGTDFETAFESFLTTNRLYVNKSDTVWTVSRIKIEKSDKLLKLQVNIGEEKPRQIVAGLAKFYSPEELIDRKVCVVANLQPAKLFGTLSEGMILATGESGALLSPDENAEIGERIQ